MKAHYKKFMHDEEEMIAQLDTRVDLDQFLKAIEYWKEPEVEVSLNIHGYIVMYHCN